MTTSAHLEGIYQNEAGVIRRHPWVTAAARDELSGPQLSAWARQDLAWGTEYAEVMRLAAANAPARAKSAFAWLDGNMDTELAWLTELSERYPLPAGADAIWPSYWGYARWAVVEARKGPLHALTVAATCESAYGEAFAEVAAGRPGTAEMKWAARNWGGPEFAAMVMDLRGGWAELADATPGASVGELAGTVRATVAWEAECMTANLHLTSWRPE